MVTRRRFLGSLICAGALSVSTELQSAAGTSQLRADPHQPTARPIDRAALVRRHNPRMRTIDPSSPLSVGNGEFAFTVDVTGLQSIPQEYQQAMPLCTLSQWGWHTTPSNRGFSYSQLRLAEYDTHGRPVGYPTSSTGQTELFNWLRENPHRLHLGQIGLWLREPENRAIKSSEITGIDQTLDLWTGLITSKFLLLGQPVETITAVHPERDLVAIRVKSPLCAAGRLGIRIEFPYGSPAMAAADWEVPKRHETREQNHAGQIINLHRTLDKDEYFAAVKSPGARKNRIAEHTFEFSGLSGNSTVEFAIEFSPHPVTTDIPDVAEVFKQCEGWWENFWLKGAAVELADSRDKRASELERRIVLSQYLTAIQCSGSLPPQETGLTVNSWNGKFHLEMHWWHAAHFAAWNRLPMLEKSLAWYGRILPLARQTAHRQGYSGARWPKMVGPDGLDSPSPIGPLLIWQQPHPIVYAELCYRTNPNRTTLDKYRAIVDETAMFMASFAFFEKERERYVLGPPVIPAQENHPAKETWNPTFELGYWRYALGRAQQWRTRSGLARNPEWDRVINRLSNMPVKDGLYLAHENCPQTFTERNHDHPSMLYALGVLPGNDVDFETMRRTLIKVKRDWQWDETWGWDFPAVAMTAARLGETKTAIDILMMETGKNTYLANGHNRQRPNLPCYLPGNGGLLSAIAMMSSGWKGAPNKDAPGFPNDGSWSVKSEGFSLSGIN